MPFSAHRTFVYEIAIKKAIERMNEELSAQQTLSLQVNLEPQRADEIFTPNNDKVKQIKNLIEKSDVVIVDISELNPNVLWELGYSTALRKYTIIISEEVRNLPFNIQINATCSYSLSFSGMSDLEEELVKRLRVMAFVALKEKKSLIRHTDFVTASKHVTSTLKRIRVDSLLTRLALNELTRIGTRFEKLAKGLFELRNVKPYEEVIEYYCQYVSQLKGANSSFNVVSNLNFWKEITRGGTDFRYILYNARAARQGARIQRIILINASQFKNKTVKEDDVFVYILKALYERQKDLKDNFQTKLYFSNHFATVRETYSNFGILTKDSEILLFKPLYEGSQPSYEDSRMKETAFIYVNKQGEYTDEHLAEITSYESLFSEVWEKGEMLNETHFS